MFGKYFFLSLVLGVFYSVEAGLLDSTGLLNLDLLDEELPRVRRDATSTESDDVSIDYLDLQNWTIYLVGSLD